MFSMSIDWYFYNENLRNVRSTSKWFDYYVILTKAGFCHEIVPISKLCFQYN